MEIVSLDGSRKGLDSDYDSERETSIKMRVSGAEHGEMLI